MYIEKNLFKLYRYLNRDNIRHYEQGIRFNPQSFLYNIINKKNKNIHILGSNFSCFKEDIYAINGFDEDILGCSKDDVDLEWRFVLNGCKLKSCKYCANLLHLNHTRNSREDEEEIARQQMKKNKDNNKFICTNGMIKNI